MTWSELRSRFPRTTILVVADFRRDLEAVRVLKRQDARIQAAGLGGEAERSELAALGVDAGGIGETRGAVLEAALERLGRAGAVLFGSGDWQAEREGVFDAERELAIADGRSLRPLIALEDERYAFLETPERAALFALARAAGADFETAQRAASRKRQGGHKNEDRRDGGGARSRTPRPRNRKAS